MKVIVSYSGGKDSQACLLWAVETYGSKNVEAVFCDTGWEHPVTYAHIHKTTKALGVNLVTIKSKKYDGMIDMAEKKKRFPAMMSRFCTSELKINPFIDYVLEQKDHLLIIQGIRALESSKRSTMQRQCTYFKYYFEAYNDKGRKHSYRKKEVIEWTKKYADDLLRPVFDWTGQQVIDYIIEKGQEPNQLYKEGFKRVGCFPCIMSGHSEVYEIIKRYPEHFDEIIEHEKRIGSSFFKMDFVPKWARTGVGSSGQSFTTAEDVRKYLLKKYPSGISLFDDEPITCASYYHLCE